MGNYKYSTDWIYKLEGQNHWMQYWNQLNILLPQLSQGDRILEIGVGTKFTSNYLKSKGYDVTTIDIDAKKKPDIVANIVDYQFSETYDFVIAFEVFEHIPFEDFQKILPKISKIFKKRIIMSMPRNEKVWVNFQMIFPGNNKFAFQITTKRNKIISLHHHWEIDYLHYNKAYLEGVFSKNNLNIDLVKKINSIVYFQLSGK